MYPLAKYLLYTTGMVLLATIAVTAFIYDWRFPVVILTFALAIALRFIPKFRGYQFTAWIIAVVAAAMIYPAQFLHVGNFDMRNKWVMLIAIQLVMFGMGTQMSLHDFAGVAKSPRGVFVGIFCHFTVMPLVGLTLTKIFSFPPEIAAGVILIGSCSSGLASNVMAYIARSNLALSVTVTAITTMIAPIMTPLWMKLLAGTMVEVKFFNMMVEIVKIVLVPISAALIHDYLKRSEKTNRALENSLSPSRGEGQGEGFNPISNTISENPHLTPPSAGAERETSNSTLGRKIVFGLAALGVAWDAFLVFGGWEFFKTHFAADSLTAIALFGFLISAVTVGVIYHGLTKGFPRLDSFMPVASMVGIVYVTAMTTASGRDNLLQVGALLFVASAMHNTAGYFFGYFLSRGVGLDKNSARSIAFEVGLQNGGMASGLAVAMGKLSTVGLAAAIFIPWMNVSGSVLANYWHKRPVKE